MTETRLEWSTSHGAALIVATLLEIGVAIVIAIGVGGGWTEWKGRDREPSNTGGASFGPCIAPSCGEESGGALEREPPPLLEAVFGVPLLLAPGLIGAVPAVVRSFSARVGFLWFAGFSLISVILGFVLYFVVGALLFIGILRYVLDPSLLPEIILFPLALLPIPWVVDRVVRILLS